MKKILTTLLVLALIAAIVAGVLYGVRKTSEKTIEVYRVGELNMGGYLPDEEKSTEGYVTSDVVQNIYATEALVIKEILVREGQEVAVGDTLLSYDMEKTKLGLEKAELEEQAIRLQIDVADRNLAILESLKPTSGDSAEEVFLDEPEDGDWEADIPDDVQPSYENAVCYDVLNEKSVPYNREENAEDGQESKTEDAGSETAESGDESSGVEDLRLGAERNPYRFLCRNGAVIEPSFLYHMKKTAGNDRSLYIQLEVRKGDKVTGRLIEAWEMDASRFRNVSADWTGRVIVDDYTEADAEEPDGEDESDVAPPEDSSDASVPEDDSVLPPEDESAGRPADESADSGEPPAADSSLVPENPTDGEESSDEGESVQPESGESSDEAMPEETVSGVSGGISHNLYEEGMSDAAQGMKLRLATADMTTKFLLTAVDNGESVTSSEKKEKKNSRIAASIGLLAEDAQMTADEIKEAGKQERQTIKSLKLDLREAVLKKKAAQKAVEDGSARAKMNGVVKKITQPEDAKAQGMPIVQVAAAEGLFVKSALPESLYGTVKDGDYVSVVSWTSGQTFAGRVRDVSDYPDSSGMFGYGSGTTFYPMIIYISDQHAAISDGEWVQITVSSSGEQEFDPIMGRLSLSRAFIREDGDGRYVLLRGGDGTLVKQYIVTGEQMGDGYEIISGVTEDDWVAFPYGRNLTEGSKTREGKVGELYAS